MALFAGDKGVEAGDELTYDYNFTWFKGVTQIQCKCGTKKCRGVLGKRSDRKTPPKKDTEEEAKPSKKGRKKGPAKRTYKKRTVAERIQQSVIINPVKKERKPPFPRRPPTPPPIATTPELETLPQTSDDDSVLSDIEDVLITKAETTPKPLTKTTRTRSRPLRTYKVNKTIAKSSVPKSITSKSAVEAAKADALEEALAEATGKENTIGKVVRKTAVAVATEKDVLEEEPNGKEMVAVGGILGHMGTVNDMAPTA